MIEKGNYLSAVSTDSFNSFLKNRFDLNINKIEKRIDKKYGYYFLVYAESDVYLFGNIGLLKVENKTLVDDIETSVKNYLFVQEYIAFVMGQQVSSKSQNKNKQYVKYAKEKIDKFFCENKKETIKEEGLC